MMIYQVIDEQMIPYIKMYDTAMFDIVSVAIVSVASL
jgi:hypothetical protein